MRHFLWFLLLLPFFFLTACTSNGSGASCKGGVCVNLEVMGPVRASEPALFTISIKTEKDIVSLGISLNVGSNVTVSDIEKSPKESAQRYKDKNLMTWTINTKGGQEYVISGHVILDKPSMSYGISSYMLILSAGNSAIPYVNDMIRIYLDAKGDQLDDESVKILSQTRFPLPTSRPDLTVVPETPRPTLARPTLTSLPSPTPTQPAYPAPGKPLSTVEVNQKAPLVTPTQAAYPSP